MAAIPSPALAIPELLVKYFAHERPAALMVLAAVCRRWKDAVYDQSLWTDISITEYTALPQLRRQLDLSGSRLLDVDFTFKSGSRAAVSGLCRILFAEIWRIQVLDVEMFHDEGGDDSGSGFWPQELAGPLTSEDTWPNLRHLTLCNSSPSPHTDLKLDINAPKLETLFLDGVSTSQWPNICYGPTMQDIALTHIDSMSGAGDTIRNCSGLRRLHLEGGESQPADLEALRIILPCTPAPFMRLVDVYISWEKVDIRQLLSFLAHCPRLERLLLDVNACDDYNGPLDADFQLHHLEVLHLGASPDQPSAGRILRVLMPVVASARLRELTLRAVDMDVCEAVLQPSLQKLDMNGVRVDAATFIHALRQCQQLRTLTLCSFQLSTLDESLVNLVQRLPALCEATLIASTSEAGVRAAADVEVENQRMVRLFLAIVDCSGIPTLNIGIPLATEYVTQVCDTIGDQGSVSLELQNLGSTRFDVCALNEPETPFRTFYVTSLVDSLPALDSKINFLSIIARLTVDLESAVEFFTALPSAARLPSLNRLTLDLRFNTGPQEVTTVLDTIFGVCGGIDCPRLLTLTLDNSFHDDDEDQPLRVAKTVVDRFVGLFHSQMPVELETPGVLFEPEET